jgi:hypothetical protein
VRVAGLVLRSERQTAHAHTVLVEKPDQLR